MANDLCIQQLEELVVVLSTHGENLKDVAPIGLLQAAQALSDGDSDAAYAAAAAHAGCSCSGVLHLVAEQSGRLMGLHSHCSASLLFTMTSGYPAAAALQCHVSSEVLPRATVDALSQQVRDQAAAAQGSGCLYDVAEALQEALNHLQQQQQEQECSQLQQQPQRQGDEACCRRVLLRLDHMRDRAGYSAIIKQWAADLQLTGWLLFWQSLILILLEGSSEDINTYLRKARTTCVDVDSNGRKCRERMLTIVEDFATAGPSSGRAATALLEAAAVPSDRFYQDFRELNLQSLEAVVQQLSLTHPQLDAQAVRRMMGLS